METQINGEFVPIFGAYAELAVNSHQFKDWVKSIDPRFNIMYIVFQSVDFDDRKIDKPVRFIKFYACVVDGSDGPLGGIVFMRGGSVVILTVLECDGNEYTILTMQPRFPSGIFSFPEIPAGTMEESGNFVGGAARELREEAEIEVKLEDLIDLTQLIYGDNFKGVYTTVGGSDEFLRIFCYRIKVDSNYLEELEGKCTGLDSENEQIQLKVIPLRNLVLEAPDAKSLSALMLYQTAKLRGMI